MIVMILISRMLKLLTDETNEEVRTYHTLYTSKRLYAIDNTRYTTVFVVFVCLFVPEPNLLTHPDQSDYI